MLNRHFGSVVVSQGGDVSTPPAPSWGSSSLDERYFWIDVGSFMDRFEEKALALTSSSDPDIQGLITLLLPRRYIDLKHPALTSWLDLLVSKGLINSTEKALILTPRTTAQERHIAGLAQPTD